MISAEAIERIEEKMRQVRRSLGEGDPAAQVNQKFTARETIHPKIVCIAAMMVHGRQVVVEAVPEELSGPPDHPLARTVRFEQTRPDRDVQKAVISFSTPVEVRPEGIFAETQVKDAKGRQRLRKMPFDLLLPFRGDEKARKEMRSFGAKYIK